MKPSVKSVKDKFFRQKPCADKAGFSLIEIVLALLVMAIGIVTLLSIFPAGLNFSRMSYEETRMAQAAETILNAIETELRIRPQLWERKWGGVTTRRWPNGTTESVSNTVYGTGNSAYNWHLHKLTNGVPTFNVWEYEDDLAPVFISGSHWVTNSFVLQNYANLVDYSYRYNLSISSLDDTHHLAELLSNPEGKHLYNPDPASTWPSANPATKGELPPPMGIGLPPYENDFFAVRHPPPQEYRIISANMYKVTVRMVPGAYGVAGAGSTWDSQRRRFRDFHRYYYDFGNH